MRPGRAPGVWCRSCSLIRNCPVSGARAACVGPGDPHHGAYNRPRRARPVIGTVQESEPTPKIGQLAAGSVARLRHTLGGRSGGRPDPAAGGMQSLRVPLAPLATVLGRRLPLPSRASPLGALAASRASNQRQTFSFCLTAASVRPSTVAIVAHSAPSMQRNRRSVANSSGIQRRLFIRSSAR